MASNTSEVKVKFKNIALVFGINRLKRSLNIISSNTRNNDTGSNTPDIVDNDIRDLKGTNLI